MIPPKYAKKSPHELLLMGYGAFGLFAVVAPERFGKPAFKNSELPMAADRASRELKRMFHKSPMKPWKSRDKKVGLEIMKFARRQLMEAPIAIKTEP